MIIYEKKINSGQDSIGLTVSYENDLYELYYVVLGRKNVTAAEKKAGLKKTRYIKEEKKYAVNDLTPESILVVPCKSLTDAIIQSEDFIKILKKGD
ncbi:hypothetical protein H3J60_004523 [Salmonella enterica]|nr:hypothetical protein [Salmonella enterica]